MRNLKLLVLAAVLSMGVNASADATQTISKVLGQCRITKATVLKSKDLPHGSQAVDEVATLEINRYIAQGSDETYFNMGGATTKSCPSLGCDSAGIFFDGKAVAEYKANSAEKLDVTFHNRWDGWIRLTYDYAKRIGKIERRTKINGWGFTTIRNDYFVHDLAECTFQGPIDLDPSHP